MQPYRVVFTGYVNETTRPAGFPQRVTAEKLIGSENKTGVYNFIQRYLKDLMAYGAMGTIKPELDGKIIDPETSIEDSILVPLHMFSHFSVEIQLISTTVEDMEKGGPIN